MTSTITFDIAALSRAIEARDAEAQLAHYRPDAELTLVDHDNGPGNPRVIRGTAELRSYFTDLCDRDMTHEVRAAVAGSDHVAFEVDCRYPDGTRVLCMCVGGVVDGRLAWHRQVQAWDVP